MSTSLRAIYKRTLRNGGSYALVLCAVFLLIVFTSNSLWDDSAEKLPQGMHNVYRPQRLKHTSSKLKSARSRASRDKPKVSELSKNKLRVKAPAKHILIYAQYRTGSTFVSEFFFKHKSIAFMFEPLYESDNPDSVLNGQDILWDLLHCRLNTTATRRIPEEWFQLQVFCHVDDQTPGCRYLSPVPLESAQKHCDSSTARAIKIIRVPALWHLEEFLSRGVHVVHVIRDPRGLLHSYKGVHGQGHTALSYCQQALQDFAYINTLAKTEPNARNLYHVVRYEDTALEAEAQMKSIYAKINMSPDNALRKWVAGVERDTRQGALNNRGYAFGVDRSNPGYTATAWRYDAEFDLVARQQVYCKDLMRIMGYVTIDSEANLRDRNKPVLEKFNHSAMWNIGNS